MKNKNKNKQRVSFRPVQSTQQNIPVRDIINGLVVTKNDDIYKIMEVIPAPFFLKKISEQNKIGDNFEALLKAAPDELHIKSISVPADMSNQVHEINDYIKSQESPIVKLLAGEYRDRLQEAQDYGVTRRFFISIPFLGKTRGLNKADINEINYTLSTDAERIKNSLENCGNVVLTDDDTASRNLRTAKLFYLLFNRNRYLKETFEENYNKISKNYQEHYNGEEFYIPPTDFLAPDSISYKESKYLIIDGMYYSFLYIPSYGYRTGEITGWISSYVNSFNGVDVDIFIKRKSKDEVNNSIRRNIGQAKVSASETYDTTDSYETSSQALSAGYYLKNGLSRGQDFYYVSTIITICAESPERVDFIKNELQKFGRSNDVILRENAFECEQMFNQVLPCSRFDESFFKKMKRNMLTEGVASFYPFTTYQMIDTEGIYLADDKTNGSPVLINFFNPLRLTNPHIFVCGESGAGKTSVISELAMRAHYKWYPVYMMLPVKQNDSRRLSEVLGGQYVAFGSGSSSRINIMEIRKEDENIRHDYDDEYSNRSQESYLEKKISSVLEFCQILISDIGIEEKQILNAEILNTYNQFNINKNNDSLWADKEKTRYKKMPTLSNLVKNLEHNPKGQRLALALKLLTTGAGAHFDGQTNIDVNNDFFIIGLENNPNELMGLAIYVAMDYIWSKVKENSQVEKFWFFDEWWLLAKNEIGAEKSMEIAKIARSFGCSMVISTQDMQDIMHIADGKYGKAVLNNCESKIILQLKKNEALAVRELVDLTNKEFENIVNYKPGNGLLIAGQNRMSLQFNPTKTEQLVIFSDRESKKRYREFINSFNFEQKRAKEYEEYDDLDDMVTSDDFIQNIDEIDTLSAEQFGSEFYEDDLVETGNVIDKENKNYL